MHGAWGPWGNKKVLFVKYILALFCSQKPLRRKNFFNENIVIIIFKFYFPLGKVWCNLLIAETLSFQISFLCNISLPPHMYWLTANNDFKFIFPPFSVLSPSFPSIYWISKDPENQYFSSWNCLFIQLLLTLMVPSTISAKGALQPLPYKISIKPQICVTLFLFSGFLDYIMCRSLIAITNKGFLIAFGSQIDTVDIL